MSNYSKAIVKARKREISKTTEIKLRKHLNADALFKTMRTGFAGIRDHRLVITSHQHKRVTCVEYWGKSTD